MALNRRIDDAALKEIHHLFVVTAMFGYWRIVFRRPFMSTTSLQLTLTSKYVFYRVSCILYEMWMYFCHKTHSDELFE